MTLFSQVCEFLTSVNHLMQSVRALRGLTVSIFKTRVFLSAYLHVQAVKHVCTSRSCSDVTETYGLRVKEELSWYL